MRYLRMYSSSGNIMGPLRHLAVLGFCCGGFSTFSSEIEGFPRRRCSRVLLTRRFTASALANMMNSAPATAPSACWGCSSFSWHGAFVRLPKSCFGHCTHFPKVEIAWRAPASFATVRLDSSDGHLFSPVHACSIGMVLGCSWVCGLDMVGHAVLWHSATLCLASKGRAKLRLVPCLLQVDYQAGSWPAIELETNDGSGRVLRADVKGP